MPFSVMGTGSALPKRVVTNDELSTFLETDDEWIRTRSGISTRHVCTDESTSDLAERAARAALENADVDISDIDLIVCATVSADHLTPSLACVLADRLGARCPAFDVNAACAGFVFALDVVDGYFARGRAQTALIVASESMSRILDWSDRSTCVLFGDGAGAQVVCAQGANPIAAKFCSCGSPEMIARDNIAGNSPFRNAEPITEGLRMNGREVFRFAVTSICDDVAAICEQANVSIDDVDHFVFHQANGRILDSAASRLGIDPAKVARTIGDTGNISSACIPLALDRLNRAGSLHQGDLVLCAGFGAGLVTAAMLFSWGMPLA